MKKNPVKASLREGKPQVGTWLSFGHMPRDAADGSGRVCLADGRSRALAHRLERGGRPVRGHRRRRLRAPGPRSAGRS